MDLMCTISMIKQYCTSIVKIHCRYVTLSTKDLTCKDKFFIKQQFRGNSLEIIINLIIGGEIPGFTKPLEINKSQLKLILLTFKFQFQIHIGNPASDDPKEKLMKKIHTKFLFTHKLFHFLIHTMKNFSKMIFQILSVII